MIGEFVETPPPGGVMDGRSYKISQAIAARQEACGKSSKPGGLPNGRKG
jgi:hypothetical protein